MEFEKLLEQVKRNTVSDKRAFHGIDADDLIYLSPNEVIKLGKAVEKAEDLLNEDHFNLHVEIEDGNFEEAIGRIAQAVNVGSNYGFVDDAHHKQWVITEMIKVLVGEKEFSRWTNEWKDISEWDCGTAP